MPLTVNFIVIAPERVSAGVVYVDVLTALAKFDVNVTLAFCVAAPVRTMVPWIFQFVPAVVARVPVSNTVVAPNTTLTRLSVDAVAANVPAASNSKDSPSLPKVLAVSVCENASVSVAAVLPVVVMF